MTNIKNIIGTVLILTLLFSCGSNQTNNTPTPKQETPEALKDDNYDYKNYRRSNNLTEELYRELVDKTPELKKMEDDLDAYSTKPNGLNAKVQQYESKSNNYYGSANIEASAITDSLLRLKIMALITTSNQQFPAMTAELNSLLKQISKNDATLNDHHSVLKILLTLPVIEKYQDENKPDKKEFIDLINQQEKLIFQTDSLTPKY